MKDRTIRKPLFAYTEDTPRGKILVVSCFYTLREFSNFSYGEFIKHLQSLGYVGVMENNPGHIRYFKDEWWSEIID